jgi:hypothetical protein
MRSSEEATNACESTRPSLTLVASWVRLTGADVAW